MTIPDAVESEITRMQADWRQQELDALRAKDEEEARALHRMVQSFEALRQRLRERQEHAA